MSETLVEATTFNSPDPRQSLGEFLSNLVVMSWQRECNLLEFDIPVTLTSTPNAPQAGDQLLLLEFRCVIRDLAATGKAS